MMFVGWVLVMLFRLRQEIRSAEDLPTPHVLLTRTVHTRHISELVGFINTLLQRGAGGHRRENNRFSGFVAQSGNR
jgi:hypothetical protein